MTALHDKRALASILAAGAMLSLIYAAILELHLPDILDSSSMAHRIFGGLMILLLLFPLPLAIGDCLGIFRCRFREMFMSLPPPGEAPGAHSDRARIMATTHSAAALVPALIFSLSLAQVGVNLLGRPLGLALFYCIPALTLYLVRIIGHDGRTGPVFQRCVITLGAGIGVFWAGAFGMDFLRSALS
ncbi:hypothetical protein [Paracoccus sp. ME4]|uniref:hypothetical protein n=1 Tax=Paracoccus sp. ME4 TaxID=3138066 RepID=UPI00398B90EB